MVLTLPGGSRACGVNETGDEHTEALALRHATDRAANGSTWSFGRNCGVDCLQSALWSASGKFRPAIRRA
jgi:hypothetical protein